MDAKQFTTVDWVEDADAQNRVRLLRSRNRISWQHVASAATTWLIHAVSAAIIGVIAVLLTLATNWLADLRTGHCSTSWYLSEATCCLRQSEEACTAWVSHPNYVSFLIYLLYSTGLAILASLLVTSLAPLAAGSGISEIKCIISGFYAPQFLQWMILVVKCIALPLTIAAGFSVGKEGPSVHYSACVGHIVTSKLGKLDFKKRVDILTACCAAGVAVAFGSPIGGTLFGLEEMAADISLNTIWRSYFCSLIATSVVSILNPFRTGQLVLFSVRYDTTWGFSDLPFFVMLGVFGGAVGHYIVTLNLRITALRKKFMAAKPHCVTEAAVIAFITAFVCYFNSYLRIDMTQSMQILFHECDHGGETHFSCDADNKMGIMLSLLFACAVRLVLLLVTYGSVRVPAGIFVPSLFIGALFGRFLGTLVWMVSDGYSLCSNPEAPCVNPGAYALLGAGALLSGVMHIPLTVVVVMFELTGALHYVAPTMVVVGVTRLTSVLLKSHGIADQVIRENAYPYLERDPGFEFDNVDAASIMVKAEDCTVVRGDGAVPRNSNTFRTFPVVDSSGMLIGATSGAKRDNSPITVRPSESLETVYTIFARLGPHTIYVVDSGYFKGLITRKMVGAFTHPAQQKTFTALEIKIGLAISSFYESIESKCLSTLSSRLYRRS